MKFKLAALVLGIVFVAAPRTALAYSAPGPVQDIWTENMPGTVTFVLSYGMPSGCGSVYFTSSTPDTVKAVYAMLMASVLAGRNVWVQYYGSSCQAQMVHGLNP